MHFIDSASLLGILLSLLSLVSSPKITPPIATPNVEPVLLQNNVHPISSRYLKQSIAEQPAKFNYIQITEFPDAQISKDNAKPSRVKAQMVTISWSKEPDISFLLVDDEIQSGIITMVNSSDSTQGTSFQIDNRKTSACLLKAAKAYQAELNYQNSSLWKPAPINVRRAETKANTAYKECLQDN